MKHLARLTLVLILGAAVNIAVACAFAAFGTLDHAKIHTIGWCTPAVALWRIDRADGSGQALYSAECDRLPAGKGDLHLAPGLRALGVPGWADPGTRINAKFKIWRVHAAGWPMLALSGGARIRVSPTAAPQIETWNVVQCQSHFLPLWPVPLGFTINTLLYAAAFGLVPLAPRALRTHLRHRRNLCPHCAYNLSGLRPNSPCPECGAVPRASRSSAMPVSPDHP